MRLLPGRGSPDPLAVIRLEVTAPASDTRPAPIAELWWPREPAGTKLPLVLYFPGWSGTSVDNLCLVKTLARKGYAVAAAHYPAPRPGLSMAVVDRQRAELERPMDFSSEAAGRDTLDRAERRVRQRAEDAGAILDAAAKLGGDRLDCGKAGIFGFSLGGAVAAEACLRDPRFKAAVNFDGWHFADALHGDILQPYLFIGDGTPLPDTAELTAGDPATRFTARLNRQTHDAVTRNLQRRTGYRMRIDGSQHRHFAGSLRPSLMRRAMRRPGIAPWRVLQIACDYTGAFFDTYLRGQPSALLGGAPRYPEVRFLRGTNGSEVK